MALRIVDPDGCGRRAAAAEPHLAEMRARVADRRQGLMLGRLSPWARQLRTGDGFRYGAPAALLIILN